MNFKELAMIGVAVLIAVALYDQVVKKMVDKAVADV